MRWIWSTPTWCLLPLLAIFGCGHSAQREPSPPLRTAADLFTEAKKANAAGRTVEALALARELVTTHAGTPEADSATRRMQAFEAADSLSREAEHLRAIQAAADDEDRRLANKWTYSVTEDPMTSRRTLIALIQSENTVSFDFPYQGAQHGTLMIRDHPRYGRDVIFCIERGQLLCHSSDCEVQIRFDDDDPFHWNAVGAADNSNESIFFQNEMRFVKRLRSSRVLRLQVRVYQEGNQIFVFHVGGFDYTKYRSGT